MKKLLTEGKKIQTVLVSVEFGSQIKSNKTDYSFIHCIPTALTLIISF